MDESLHDETRPLTPGEIPPGTFYTVPDRWVRKGDVLVMGNVETNEGLRPRIAARFYGFSPSGSDLDSADCPDNVAPLMAFMFETMSNDGMEAVKEHLRQGKVVLLNPRSGLITPDGL